MYTVLMKSEYREGPKAKANLEDVMKRIFRTPKTLKQEKQQDKPTFVTVGNSGRSERRLSFALQWTQALASPEKTPATP